MAHAYVTKFGMSKNIGY